MMKFLFLLCTAVLTFSSISNKAQAHCEIPCGVFDDSARFDTILEHAFTIEKSMNSIKELNDQDKQDLHMIMRWTVNKEEHANKIQNIAAQYFLTQRVKVPGQDASEEQKQDYTKNLKLLHQIMVAAMKTKQTLDVSYVNQLRDLTEEYKTLYFKEHGHKH